MEQQTKPPIYKRTWFWVVVIFLILSYIGNHELDQTQSTRLASSEDGVEENTPTEEVIKVSATQLAQDYKDNEVAADAKYKGKPVEISGIVETIGKDILDTPYIALKSYEYAIIDKVQCMFSKSDVEELAKIVKDQQIVLRGEVSGKLGNILVRGCEVVK